MNASAIVCHVALAFNSRRFFIMTYTSKQKTFYAKQFEEVLRNYFNCPSKTPSGKPFPYIFMHNKDNDTNIFRTKENGMSDVYLKSIQKDGTIEEKFITFFNFYNGYDEFTVNEYCWHNFIEAVNKSNEKNIYGVFCIDKDNFILIDNTDTTVFYKEYIAMNQTITQGYGIKRPHMGLLFSYVKTTWCGEVWNIYKMGELVDTIEPNHNYSAILEKNSFCLPLPRQGEKHLFITEDNGFCECSFREIAEKYHGEESLDSFRKKLSRYMKFNEAQYQKNMRLKPLKGSGIIVIPDNMTEQDFIVWQKDHPKVKVNKTESMKDYMKDYRLSKKSLDNPGNLECPDKM